MTEHIHTPKHWKQGLKEMFAHPQKKQHYSQETEVRSNPSVNFSCINKNMWYTHTVEYYSALKKEGLPLWLSWQRIYQQCGRPGFDPWVGKIPWRRERLPTPVFWPGEFHGLYSPWGCKELDTTEWLLLKKEGSSDMWYNFCLKKKEILTYGTTWVGLEDVILSEISQS